MTTRSPPFTPRNEFFSFEQVDREKGELDVAPDGREGMMQHARDFAAEGIPFVFDPARHAHVQWRCIAGIHESGLLMPVSMIMKPVCSPSALAALFCAIGAVGRALIVTRGGEGSETTPAASAHHPRVKADALLAPYRLR